MAFTVQPDSFRFEDEFRAGVAGKRVLITGAGKDGGLGQAFALAAGLNGAASVGVHFHSSYSDGFDLVNALRELDVNAFPVQADVTNLGDLWATRSYVIEQMGGKPPNLLICNSGLTEKGYAFGRALKEIPDEPLAMRRARVRQHFIDSLHESRLVLNTKIDGFLAMTHLWAGEAVYHQEFLQLIYVSSRQAIDPGAYGTGLRDQQLGRASTARSARDQSRPEREVRGLGVYPAAIHPHQHDRPVRGQSQGVRAMAAADAGAKRGGEGVPAVAGATAGGT